MATNTQEQNKISILDNLQGTRDAMAVSRVFGDAYTVGDVTVIPVARMTGKAGGGGGEGTGPGDEGGRGFGTGFGLGAQPVGVYNVHDGNVCWKPAVDVTRLAKGAQVLAGVVAICVSLVLLRRQR